MKNKNINFNKNETESKMENPTHIFRETNLVLKESPKLKVKLYRIEATERKKRTFFVPFMFLAFVFFPNV